MVVSALCVALALCLSRSDAAPAAGYVAAARAQDKNAAGDAAKPPVLNQKVGKPLQEALKLTQEKKWKDALAKVEEANTVGEKTPFEVFTIIDFAAYIHAQLGDFAKAARASEAALATGLAPPEQLQARLKALTQMNYQIKNYAKAIEFGSRYVKDGDDPDIQILVGQAYFLEGDYASAVAALKAAVALAERTKAKIDEDWLALLMAAQRELKDGEGVRQTLTRLVRLFPSPRYWDELILMLEKDIPPTEKLGLDLSRLRMAVGLMTDAADFMDMAQSAIQEGLPGEAQAVVEYGYGAAILGVTDKDRHFRMLTMATHQAEQDRKSLPQLETEAKAARTGEADVKLGEAYWSHGLSDQAIAAIRRGLAKGGVKNPDKTKLHLGIILLGAGAPAEAEKTWADLPPGGDAARIAELWAIVGAGIKS